MPLHTLKEADLREYCRRAIEALEFWLRRLIDDELTKAHGPDYITANDEHGNHVINNELRRSLTSRQAREPERYPRLIDAAELEDEIRILCNPNLYKRLFREALENAFPLGDEQARATLNRLLGPRNALSHGNPISVRQAEQVICYTGDVTDSLKRYYGIKNLARQYDVPTVIRYSDWSGTTLHENQLNRGNGGCQLSFNDDSDKYLRVGDTLSMEIEIDPSFDPQEYAVRWVICGSKTPEQTGPQLVLRIEMEHVNQNFEIHCYVTSNKEWHRFGGWDDFLAVRFKVLPPGR